MPPKDKLFKVLKDGMSREEVIEVFGKPTFDDSKTQKNDFRLRYAMAPEKRAANPEGKILLNGFRVEFKNNKLASWGCNYTDARRKEKEVIDPPSDKEETDPASLKKR